MEVNTSSWHYNVVRWVVKKGNRDGDPPDRCSYVRAILLWAPFFVLVQGVFNAVKGVVATYERVSTIPIVGNVATGFWGIGKFFFLSRPSRAFGRRINASGRFAGRGLNPTSDWMGRHRNIVGGIWILSLAFLPVCVAMFSFYWMGVLLGSYGVVAVVALVVIAVAFLDDRAEDSVFLGYVRDLHRQVCSLITYVDPPSSSTSVGLQNTD